MNLHILKRNSDKTFYEMTSEITNSAFTGPSRFLGKRKPASKLDELSTHMASTSPFLSMLSGFNQHNLTNVRPLGSDYYVLLTGRTVTIMYSTDIFKKYVYGGLALDEMVQVYLKLGLSAE